MTWEAWSAFALASAVLLVVPGPTVLLVLSYALSRGRRVAVSVALGVAAGDLLAMSVSLLGLGALLATSAAAFTVLKWLGALYLLYLGIRMWRAPPPAADLPPARPGEAWATFRHAALVTALNPKSIPFFVAFVPLFIDPARPLGPQAVPLVATFVGLAALNSLLWALAADALRARLTLPLRAALQKGSGAMLIVLSAALALTRRSPA